jgi:hypothetical protein
MAERCPMCSRLAIASVQACECGSPFGQELGLPAPQVQRLTRAWLGIGVGGLSLLLVSALTLGHMVWSSLATWLAGLGAVLVVRGARVVSQARPHRLAAPLRAALPAARVMPPTRPRGSDEPSGH